MPASLRLLALVALVCVAGQSIVRGQGPHYDIFVTSGSGGLVIGGYDDAATTATVPPDQLRVFGGEVVPSGTGAPYESASPGEPGFRAATQSFLDNPSLTTPAGVYSALPAGVPLTFAFLPMTVGSDTRNVFFWSGTGSVGFAPAAADVMLDLTKTGAGGWTKGITGTSSAVTPGDTIQVTSTGASPGAVHTHLFTSISQAGGEPDQGFYLFSLGLQMSGLADADPLYFIYGAIDPDTMTPQELADFEVAHADAEAWVETNLVSVPEPMLLSTAVSSAVIGGALRLRRRRFSRSRGTGL